jgi:hypothetical protein
MTGTLTVSTRRVSIPVSTACSASSVLTSIAALVAPAEFAVEVLHRTIALGRGPARHPKRGDVSELTVILSETWNITLGTQSTKKS